MRRLNAQSTRLLFLHKRLNDREEALFRTVVAALERGERERAHICANEITEIRKVRNSVWRCYLMVEQAIIRLETMKSLGYVVSELKPALDLVKQLGVRLANVMPDVSSELGNVSNVLDEVLQNTSLPKSDVKIVSSKEGEEVLNEVSSTIKSRIEVKLPSPPSEGQYDVDINKLLEENKKPIKVVLYNIPKEAEDKVLRYIIEHGGEINFRQCAEDLGLTLEELQYILDGLVKKGKIVLERRGAMMT
ncbi:MAG: hypothetical protein DRJ33_08685 [Candidatus Methanomethylicota archaeon]|uniref:Uncharacterized protein n=1 Tax=Thermoproteota archaeon TaxID=2056631 RepID=A0A497ENQ3_9CREN|nr:MAG: hypothetical protein DRJ33_08685 [Candidatus Verstraetearchaeota archaeon]